MSVVVMLRMKVDPAGVEKTWTSRKDDYEAVKAQAKAAGAIHHMWAAGDGEMVIIDEWGDAASFEKFFDNETIKSMMQEAGVQGPPEVTVLERRNGPDEF